VIKRAIITQNKTPFFDSSKRNSAKINLEMVYRKKTSIKITTNEKFNGVDFLKHLLSYGYFILCDRKYNTCLKETLQVVKLSLKTLQLHFSQKRLIKLILYIMKAFFEGIQYLFVNILFAPLDFYVH
jgi:hypothetical protein